MAETRKQKRLVVTAPLVQALDKSDRFQQLYRGAPVEGLQDSEVERLISLDMVGEDDGTVVPGTGLDHTKPSD